MIVDTSALFAYFVADEPQHEAVAALIDGEAASGTRLVVSPFVIAELDYLLVTRFGVAAERVVLDELSAGAWTLAQLEPGDLSTIATLVAKYAEHAIGATDASLVVLAQREGTRRIATLDRRYFTVLRALDGTTFEILPQPKWHTPALA